ncbi:hypothetical protein SAMN04515617_1128 [Collimonas sp. OK242]|nr:hypothetical protein SAMN04515617_1128 [Collimonas sp. OK242]
MRFPWKNLALQVAEATMGRQGQSRYPGVVNAPQRRSPVSHVKKYSQRGADISWESVDTFMSPAPASGFLFLHEHREEGGPRERWG